MGLKVKKYTLPFLLFFLIAISLFLFIKTIQLKKSNTGLLDDIETMERREVALKQKYSEEKAKANTMQRAKLASDSQIRSLENELETIKKEILEENANQSDLISGLKKNVNACKNNLAELTEEKDRLSARLNEESGKLAEAVEIITKMDGKLVSRQDEITELQSQLTEMVRKVERAVAHNKRLAELAEELLAELDSRNVFTSLLEKEPFTQQKRIRLERMIQEYLDRIDSEILTDSDLL